MTEASGDPDSLLSDARRALSEAKEAAEVGALRVRYLGRKGAIHARFAALKNSDLPPGQRSHLGQQLNEVKRKLEEAFSERAASLGAVAGPCPLQGPDSTLPGREPEAGGLHPITQTMEQILAILRGLGFLAVQGPEIETEFNNFEALNIPAEHPSRENFDTFYLKTVGKTPALLRSHTSPVQIRFMKTHAPPFQVAVPGRVYRPDAVDSTHCFQFHQVEGLAVSPGLAFGDLKGVLAAWAQGMFGSAARLRFRPHHFPFTEPSAEADLACIFCSSEGCRLCGRKGWLEILGCGMVHPEVFRAVGYPPGTVGFAFGMGVERIAMLTHGIEDIRLFFENDLRFLRQFP